MKSPPNRIFWLLTFAWALLLMVGSFALWRGWNRPLPTGVIGYIGGHNPTVYLREAPSASSRVLSLLERGRAVEILTTQDVQGVDWIQVEVDGRKGWVPAANVDLNPGVENNS